MSDSPRPRSGTRPAYRPLILHAEDDPATQELCATLLRAHGFEVATARDGYEAVESAIQLRPALIVMDIGLPVVNGIVAARRIKENPRTREIPIIVLTGQKFPTQKAIWWGADAVLPKPILGRELVETIRHLLYARARADYRRGESST
jgi:two-component system cell cycle response regulator DivK